MSRWQKFVLAVGVAALIAPAASGCSYNKFTAQEEAIKGQWGQVEIVLQRRSDLIPNLVETARAYAQQEKDIFQAVVDARARMTGATTPAEKMAASNAESSALARLLVVVENYPVLKSNETFGRLMDELAGTENRIAVERMRYNERVQQYNTSRRQFPSNITAAIFSFDEYPLFEVPESAKVVPKVDFNRPPSYNGASPPLRAFPTPAGTKRRSSGSGSTCRRVGSRQSNLSLC